MVRRLREADRRFFDLVARAAFSNPFSEERDTLDRRIGEVTGQAEDPLPSAVERVEQRLSALQVDGHIRPGDYGERDGESIELAVLFQAFHQFAPELDRLIERQLDHGPRACRVGFAGRLFALLQRRGLDRERSRRMLEVFYQMRRAHRFINTTLVGQSPSMQRVRESLWNNIFTYEVGRYERYLWNRMEDFSTILVGETGTGKSAAATAIGRSGFIPYDEEGDRFAVSFTETFVPVNLSEFPETLIESELFGHRKGAFTGAVEAHDGWLARCSDHGAIFLDEVGELAVPLQVKLLRVLQDRTYTPVGSHDVKRFAGRVIAATHRSLDELRRQGRLRDDFYYRLCSDVIRLPPLRTQLREQPELLDELIAHIVSRVLGASADDLAAEVCAVIRRDLSPDHRWAGNIRELEQCVRRVLLTRQCAVDPGETPTAAPSALTEEIAAERLSADQLLARYCAILYERHGSYADVAGITQLDPRTVKKYVMQAG